MTVRSLANLDITVYETIYKDAKIALYLSPVGAPACILMLEDIFALGVEKVVMFGEGTSYHYTPSADEIAVNPTYTDDFIDILDELDCSYTRGKVWTTDEFYRETAGKLSLLWNLLLK